MIIVQVSVLEAQLKATVGEVKYLSSLLIIVLPQAISSDFLFQFHDLCQNMRERKLFHNNVWFLQIFRICYLDLMICVDQNTDFKYLSFSFSLQCIVLQHSVSSDIKKKNQRFFISISWSASTKIWRKNLGFSARSCQAASWTCSHPEVR